MQHGTVAKHLSSALQPQDRADPGACLTDNLALCHQQLVKANLPLVQSACHDPVWLGAKLSWRPTDVLHLVGRLAACNVQLPARNAAPDNLDVAPFC